jgi:hypothetical protein
MSVDAFARVRAIGCALPGVEASTRYDGMPVLKLRGVFLAAMAPSGVAPATLIARVDPDDRALLLDEAPDVYFLTDQHRPHPASWSAWPKSTMRRCAVCCRWHGV